jgi:hypothetical protein
VLQLPCFVDSQHKLGTTALKDAPIFITTNKIQKEATKKDLGKYPTYY